LRVCVDGEASALENLFTLAGDPGHEIVLVHHAWLVDPSAANFSRLPSLDAPGMSAVWRDHTHAAIPLVPQGIEKLLDQSS
jgi:hypothetical protein